MLRSALWLCSFLVASSVLASPTLVKRQTSLCDSPYGAEGDAPYPASCAEMAASIDCPNGVGKSAGGTVLLVHGTGSSGPESWQNGPYHLLLPKAGPGYDICWINLPGHSLTDAQVSAAYIAYNLGALASTSTTKKVWIIGHSQGAGINPQWALLWWPSTRKVTLGYVALSGDFHGTADGPLLCDAQKVQEQGGCEPSIWQQSIGSAYLEAQNTHGNQALVPTTSLYTLDDEIIPPEYSPAVATSNLPGSSFILMQSTQVCGPGHVVDHFAMIIDPAAYALAIDALAHGGEASVSRFSTYSCTFYPGGGVITPYLFIPAVLLQIFEDTFGAVIDQTGTKAEPPLMQYVCDAGVAPQSACTSSPENDTPVALIGNGLVGAITGKAFEPGYPPTTSNDPDRRSRRRRSFIW